MRSIGASNPLVTAMAIYCLALPASARVPEPEEHGFVEQIEIARVDVPILVLDSDGQPISDLAVDEIQVSSKGRALRVASLSRMQPAMPSAAVHAQLTLDDPSGLVMPSDPAPPPERTFVLYIDLQTLDRDRRLADRNAVLAFVRDTLRPGDRVAVTVNGTEPAMELPFSSDRPALQAAVERAFARDVLPAVTERRRIEDLLDQLSECVDRKTGLGERCFRGVAVEYTAQRVDEARRSLDGLRAAIAMAAARNEPAVVLAITHGNTVDSTGELTECARAVAGDGTTLSSLTMQADVGVDAAPERAALIASAVAARVVVHAIDPTVVTASSFSSRQSRFEAGARPFEVARRAPQLDIAEIAAASGGTFRELSDLHQALSVAAALERGRYIASIDLGETLLDRDRLRRLQWRVRRPHARIIAGQGSYAASTPQRKLAATLTLGQAQTGQDGRRTLRFALLADPRSLGYAASGESWRASLAIHAELFDAAGARLDDGYLFLAHDYDATLWAAHQEGPLRISGRITLPLGTYRLLVSVHNPRDGSGGELARSFSLSARN